MTSLLEQIKTAQEIHNQFGGMPLHLKENVVGRTEQEDWERLEKLFTKLQTQTSAWQPFRNAPRQLQEQAAKYLQRYGAALRA